LREECRLRLFEIRMLRRIIGPKKDEVMGEWRRLYKANFSSPNIIRMIKLRIIICARHVARMGGTRDAYTVFRCVGLNKRDHLKGLSADGRIILKLIFK
jgi:hypothetical protein